jgi:hypothetical protein
MLLVAQKVASPGAAAKPERDARIDVLRGLALLMIFVDHMPDDLLNRVTLHNYGFCDAAEVFVLLAGFSSMLAFGRAFDRDGPTHGLRKVAARCGRIYLFHAGLLLTTLLVVQGWSTHYHMQAQAMAPILGQPVKGLAHGLTLSALPAYLDILPLYVVLLGVFPLIYLGVRRSPAAALAVSAAVWLAASLDHSINLPNWLDAKGWYFDPFSWQFMFVIGAVLCGIVARCNGILPRRRWAVWACIAYLGFAFVEAAPYHDWNLPNLQPIAMDMPDKSRLDWLRIVDVLAVFYLLLSSPRVRQLAKSPWLRPVEACGRHSLEVFALGCMLALFGRLVFRTHGAGALTEIGVNVVGFALMCGTGLWLDQARQAAAARASRRRELVAVGRA